MTLRADANHCPMWARESITRYVEDGIETGGFLRAVLENDLKIAIMRGDYQGIAALPHIVAFLVQDIAAGVWGSPEKVAAHLARKRATRGASGG